MPQATDHVTTNHGPSNVIDFASRQRPKPTPVAFSLQISGARGNLHSDSLFQLPFVTLPAGEVTDWRDFWDRATLWNDQPTDDAGEDYHRGRRYAEAAIRSIIKDDAIHHDLVLVVQRMIEGGFRRKGKGGRLCRSLASSEEGFIDALCKIAVEASRLVAAGLNAERA